MPSKPKKITKKRKPARVVVHKLSVEELSSKINFVLHTLMDDLRRKRVFDDFEASMFHRRLDEMFRR